MELKTHFFFAVKLPDEVKAMMKMHCERLQRIFPFKSWVYHEDMHITLAFLGFSPSEKLEKAEKYAAEKLVGSSIFKLRIHQLGIFGKQDRPRIFFADIEENNELQLIRRKVFSACEEAGFQLESRPFRPHITIGRKWVGEDPFQKEMLSAWMEIQPEALEFEAAEIALYQTHLNRTPKYEAIRLFSLNEKKQ